MTAAPHVRPAPKTTSKIRSPRWIFPEATASSSAMATDAADVLPYWFRFTNNLLRRRAEAFADGVNDAAVGLVRNDAFDFGNIQFAAAQRLLRRRAHRLHGVLESFLAFHAQEMQPPGHRFRGGRTAAAAAGHEQQIRLAAVRAHHRRQQAVRVGTVLQNRRARAVAEQHAGVAVLPIR